MFDFSLQNVPPSRTPFTPKDQSVQRLPGNGLMGQFDMSSVMSMLQQKYPNAQPMDLSAMADQQMKQAQMQRRQTLFPSPQQPAAPQRGFQAS